MPDQAGHRVPDWYAWAREHCGQSEYFKHDGLRLHYRSWAQPGGDKPALLFLHGFRGHIGWWQFVAPFFSDRYQVYALDFSGMGDSDHRSRYDNDCHPGEILALIDHLGLASVTAVAHSFGGVRTFRACRQRPSAFARIVAVDAHVFFPGDTLGVDPAPQRGQRFYPNLETAVSRFRLAPAQPLAQDYLIDTLARQSLRQSDRGWTWKFDPALSVNDFHLDDGDELLAGVSCPVDYFYGQDSVVVPESMARRIVAALPAARQLVMVPGGYHHLMMSHPEAVISTLQALL